MIFENILRSFLQIVPRTQPKATTLFASTRPQAPYTMDIPVLSHSTSAPGQTSSSAWYGTPSGSSGFGGGFGGGGQSNCSGGGGYLMRQATTHHRETNSQWQGLQRSLGAGMYGPR